MLHPKSSMVLMMSTPTIPFMVKRGRVMLAPLVQLNSTWERSLKMMSKCQMTTTTSAPSLICHVVISLSF